MHCKQEILAERFLILTGSGESRPQLHGSSSMLAYCRPRTGDCGSCHADVANYSSGAVPPLRFLRAYRDDANVRVVSTLPPNLRGDGPQLFDHLAIVRDLR